MNYKIYLHKNKINGKVYIGQTSEDDVNRRFRGGAGYKGSPHFYHAIQEYGWENFDHLVLEEGLTSEQADKREKFWIKAFDSLNPEKGYNLSPGGKTKTSKKNSSSGKQVICKETGQVFNSLVEAALWGGMKKTSTSNISAQIKGEKPSAGKHPVTGEPLHWCYDVGDIEIPSRQKQKPGAKRVKNLDTGEVFNSVNEAAKAYSVSNVTISKSCKSNGKIAVGPNKGRKHRWCFLE